MSTRASPNGTTRLFFFAMNAEAKLLEPSTEFEDLHGHENEYEGATVGGAARPSSAPPIIDVLVLRCEMRASDAGRQLWRRQCRIGASPPPVSDTQWVKLNSGWGVWGERPRCGLAPPMPVVAAVDAGTELRRRRGGVRLMPNRVN